MLHHIIVAWFGISPVTACIQPPSRFATADGVHNFPLDTWVYGGSVAMSSFMPSVKVEGPRFKICVN